MSGGPPCDQSIPNRCPPRNGSRRPRRLRRSARRGRSRSCTGSPPRSVRRPPHRLRLQDAGDIPLSPGKAQPSHDQPPGSADGRGQGSRSDGRRPPGLDGGGRRWLVRRARGLAPGDGDRLARVLLGSQRAALALGASSQAGALRHALRQRRYGSSRSTSSEYARSGPGRETGTEITRSGRAGSRSGE